MTHEEEIELVKRAQQNVQDFEKLYSFYVKKIYSYVSYRVYRKEDAQDITSQIFLTVVEKIGSFDTDRGTKFSSWIYQLAHNKIIDQYRRKNIKIVDLDEYEAFSEEMSNSHGSSVAADSINENDKNDIQELKKAQIAEVLLELKPNYQQVISLRFYSELEIPEIAEILKIRPMRVSVLLHRALGSFRKKFVQKFPKSEIFDFI